MPDTSLLDTIKQRLSVLNPHHLTLTDHSAAHAGHAGAKEFGGGHYHLCIISDNFHQMNRIQRHRLVYNILNDMIPYQIHAISIEAYTSDEWLKKQQQAHERVGMPGKTWHYWPIFAIAMPEHLERVIHDNTMRLHVMA